jgi:D-aspartate ligase
MRKKVIVLHAHVPGLAVIRSLGEMDVPVVAMHYEDKEMGHVSKYVTESIRLPRPGENEREFMNALVKYGEEFQGSILVPTNDLTVCIVSKNKKELEKHYVVAVPEWTIVEKVIVKKHTYEIAQRIGVPCPKTFVPNSVEELKEYTGALDFPCLVKPCEVHKFFAVFNTKMFSVRNTEELERSFVKAQKADTEIMIQEFVHGDDTSGINYNSYFVNGEPIAEFTARKVRLDPPRYGSPRVIVSERIPEIIETGRRLIRATGVYGFSCMEFKRDIRDGVYKLMEVNPRHNLSGSLAVKCGINFPWIMYRHLADNVIERANSFEPGVYWIDMTKDVFHSIFSRKEEGFPLVSYGKPYFGEKVFGVFSWQDPNPFLKRLSYILRSGVMRVTERVK